MQLIKAIEQGPRILCELDGKKKRYLWGCPLVESDGRVVVKTPWYNHPARAMWENNVDALKMYW